MKHREHQFTGAINKNGQFMIAGMDQLNSFCSEWKGFKIVGSIKVYRKGSSEALKGYYFNKIVSDFRMAFWEAGDRRTKAETEQFLRKLCPICWDETPDEETGEYIAELKEIKDMDNQELVHYIEFLRQLGAEHGLVIEDPQI